MVSIMAALGYFFAGGTSDARFWWMILGTALGAASSGVLNQYVERETDGLMERTKKRPLPAGRVAPMYALVFGLALAFLGLSLLWVMVNWQSSVLTAFTIVSYVAMYTPLKRITPHSTWIGSVSGAVPPLIGWAAYTGTLGLGAWLLFTIQFVWQIPHFLALFWIYREDYARAGHKVMPVVDPEGRVTAMQIAVHSFSLLLASLLPTVLGVSSLTYGFWAFFLGLGFMILSLRASWTMEIGDVRRLFRATLLYLPVVFTLLVAV
jgi:protoheme IX farnesyltransferase